MNPKDSVWPKTRNEVISTPVIYENKVYIANGQDPEHGEGVGHLYAIDATKRGDITQSGKIWQFDKIRRSISTGALKDGLLYYSDFSGFLHCLDAATGKEYWQHDMLAAVWGSPMIIGDNVYLGDEDGDVAVLKTGKAKKVIGEYNMGSSRVLDAGARARGVVYGEPESVVRVERRRDDQAGRFLEGARRRAPRASLQLGGTVVRWNLWKCTSPPNRKRGSLKPPPAQAWTPSAW